MMCTGLRVHSARGAAVAIGVGNGGAISVDIGLRQRAIDAGRRGASKAGSGVTCYCSVRAAAARSGCHPRDGGRESRAARNGSRCGIAPSTAVIRLTCRVKPVSAPAVPS